MGKVILPSGLGKIHVPGWDNAPHIQEMERELLFLASGIYRRLLLSTPIRHGKSQLTNLFIAWLLISCPWLRILRVMAVSDTAEMQALDVMKIIDRYGDRLNHVRLDRRKHAVSHFMTEAGGELRSVGASGNVESWTFDWIVIDDLLTDPYEIRNFNRRDQIYKDLQTKFFSRVSPTGKTKFLFIGSRRHPDDPQGRLLEADRHVLDPKDHWHYHHRAAILNEGTANEQALWPTSREFTLEGLRKIRDQKIADGVAWEWAANFQGDPTGSPDTLAFDPKWLKAEKIFYDFEPQALPKAKFKVLTTDPSMGAGNEWNDFFASLYLHIAEDGTIYVDDCYLAVAKVDAIVPMMANLIGRHQDMDIAPFESNAGGVYAAELIKRECDTRGLRFPTVFKMYGSGDDKISRITLNLWEILSHGKLKIRDTPMGRLLLSQIQQFPTAKLDGTDALATGIIVLKEMLAR